MPANHRDQRGTHRSIADIVGAQGRAVAAKAAQRPGHECLRDWGWRDRTQDACEDFERDANHAGGWFEFFTRAAARGTRRCISPFLAN